MLSNKKGDDSYRDNIVFELNKLSKAWTFPIVIFLDRGKPTRFNELKRNISGICSRSLSERLNELEKDGIIARSVTQDSPPRVEYFLTQKGEELSKILKQIVKWNLKWNAKNKV